MGLDWIIRCRRKSCDGCAHKEKIENINGMCQGLFAPPCSFRGKLIGNDYYGAEIPQKLRDKAYKDLSTKEMLEYADELEEIVDCVFDKNYRQNIQAAIEWLRYWASKRRRMIAWY